MRCNSNGALGKCGVLRRNKVVTDSFIIIWYGLYFMPETDSTKNRSFGIPKTDSSNTFVESVCLFDRVREIHHEFYIIYCYNRSFTLNCEVAHNNSFHITIQPVIFKFLFYLCNPIWTIGSFLFMIWISFLLQKKNRTIIRWTEVASRQHTCKMTMFTRTWTWGCDGEDGLMWWSSPLRSMDTSSSARSASWPCLSDLSTSSALGIHPGVTVGRQA